MNKSIDSDLTVNVATLENVGVAPIRVYGLGGCGINAVSRLIGDVNLNAALGMIDSSRSNMSADSSMVNTFLLKNVDGSGKVRKENADLIISSVKTMLLEQEPAQFNVVVFSAAGGTGSVAGPMIVKELLERGIDCVTIVVGGDESKITVNNTISTLKTLDVISHQTNKCLVMSYHHNEAGLGRAPTNDAVTATIKSLCLLASGRNDELDTKDLTTWLNYNTATSVSPQLSSLSIMADSDWLTKTTDVISLASLYASKDQIKPITCTDYITDGYCPLSLDSNELHFAVHTNQVADIFANLKKSSSRFDTVSASRDNTRKTIASASELESQSCLVF